MTNALNLDLHGKVVKLKAEYYPSTYKGDQLLFLCVSGWGCAAASGNDWIYGYYLDDPDTPAKIRAYEIESVEGQ